VLWEPEKEDDYGYLWCLPFVIKSVLNLRFIDWALKTWSNTNKMFEKGMIHAFPYGSYVAFGMSHVAHTDRDGLNKSTFEAGPWTREGILRLTDCIWGIHTLECSWDTRTHPQRTKHSNKHTKLGGCNRYFCDIPLYRILWLPNSSYDRLEVFEARGKFQGRGSFSVEG